MPAHAVLPSYDQALERIIEFAPTLGCEMVALSEALGRVLAQDIKTDRDQPPFNRSAMDGLAVQSDKIKPGGSYAVLGKVLAGGPVLDWSPNALNTDGAVLEIATGAMVPAAYDAVIPIEQAQVSQENPMNPGDATLLASFTVDSVKPGQHIHRCASDAQTGQVVIKAGTRIGPQHMGIAAAVGAVEFKVIQRPRITLLTTGDEVLASSTATDALEPQQIRNSNGPMMMGFLESLGAPVLVHEHVLDEPEHVRAAAREALSRSHLVITVGGISVGQRDFLPWAWQQLGLHMVVQGVAIKPGKPVMVAAPLDPENPDQRDNKLVIGLPGNPVSVLATAHLFVWPVLNTMFGAMFGGQTALPWRPVTLKEGAAASSKRQIFRAALLDENGNARVINWHGSGDLMHTAEARGWVALPLVDKVEPGTKVNFLPMAGPRMTSA